MLPLMVIKNDGRREEFSRDKLLGGILRSCNKRNLPMESIIDFAASIEREVRNTIEREITAKAIGELVMKRLRNFDEVAYIRFASVYRKFEDVESFRNELDGLTKGHPKKAS